MDVSTSEQLHMVGRVIAAGGFGALIGVEREVRGYPAGIRTMALVAMGAALFTDLSELFGDTGTSRVASNVVVGIGFIGAGVIVQAQGQVRGITTAATIWAAAAIGMATGLSLYIVAAAVSVFIVVGLELRPLTRRLDLFLYSILGQIDESEDNETIGLAWQRTREGWREEAKKEAKK